MMLWGIYLLPIILIFHDLWLIINNYIINFFISLRPLNAIINLSSLYFFINFLIILQLASFFLTLRRISWNGFRYAALCITRKLSTHLTYSIILSDETFVFINSKSAGITFFQWRVGSVVSQFVFVWIILFLDILFSHSPWTLPTPNITNTQIIIYFLQLLKTQFLLALVTKSLQIELNFCPITGGTTDLRPLFKKHKLMMIRCLIGLSHARRTERILRSIVKIHATAQMSLIAFAASFNFMRFLAQLRTFLT